MWKDIMNGCGVALARMVRYCKRDVSLLQKVFLRLQQHSPVAPKSHVGVLNGLEKWTCAHCGSGKIKKDKTKVSKTGVISHQMECNSSHKYFSISPLSYSAYQEHKKKCLAVRKP